jgi:hypothetical protein
MPKPPVDVARRCLCLELLLQRYVLETDADAPIAERDLGRQTWLSRVGDLGIAENLAPDERALLDLRVGALDEDALDDLSVRGAGAAVFLWALGRAPERPTFASNEAAVVDHGLLGDGSIPLARAAADGATLRTTAELEAALSSYLRLRGKARELQDAERIFASIAAHHLTWILEPPMAFDDELDLG